ncbi:MAG: hypothetical protein KAH18_09750 [Psychromonas sp.]|nr:hypothetical protein [Psychromonas sp.]
MTLPESGRGLFFIRFHNEPRNAGNLTPPVPSNPTSQIYADHHAMGHYDDYFYNRLIPFEQNSQSPFMSTLKLIGDVGQSFRERVVLTLKKITKTRVRNREQDMRNIFANADLVSVFKSDDHYVDVVPNENDGGDEVLHIGSLRSLRVASYKNPYRHGHLLRIEDIRPHPRCFWL